MATTTQDQSADWRVDHVAVVREPWLTMLRDGRKRVELRVGKRPPRAARCEIGDRVHLRPPGGAPVATMTVEGVDDWGFCDARALREIATLYARDLGVTEDSARDYLATYEGGAYVVLVWLGGVCAATDGIHCPAYQPWAVVGARRPRAASRSRRS